MPRLFHAGSPRITCDHPCHQRRGSGGEDFGLDVGTPIYAPVDGTYRFRTAGSGGWTITVIPADARLRGLVPEVMHLSSSTGLILNGASRYYREGEHVGYSGGSIGHPGAGSSTGPHTHEHAALNGRRVGIREGIAWAAAQVGGSFAGGGSAPITSPNERRRMYSLITQAPSGTGIIIQGLVGGRRMGISNPYHLGLLQRARNDDAGMLPVELDIVQGYITAVNAPVAADSAAQLQKLNAILTAIQQIDTADDTPTSVDTRQLLAAIAALSPLIDAVPDKTVNQIKARL